MCWKLKFPRNSLQERQLVYKTFQKDKKHGIPRQSNLSIRFIINLYTSGSEVSASGLTFIYFDQPVSRNSV